MKFLNVPDTLVGEWGDFSGYMPGEDAFGFLGGRITELCRKSEKEIILMIDEVDKSSDNQIFLKIVSRELFYTGGYPFLVSRLCKWLDEEGDGIWTAESVRNAETAVLASENTLFDDLIKNVENDPELKRVVRDLLLEGLDIPFVKSNETVKKGVMFGIFSSKGSKIRISNIIFETYLYNHFLIENLLGKPAPVSEQPRFISGGKLNMPRILEKFRELVLKERG